MFVLLELDNVQSLNAIFYYYRRNQWFSVLFWTLTKGLILIYFYNTLVFVQNRGLRLIAGQSMSSPCEALIAEATVNSMRCVIRQYIAKSREKALRLPEDYPRPQRLNECACQDLNGDMRGLKQTIFVKNQANRDPFEFFTVKPWEKGLGKVSVFPALNGVSESDTKRIDTGKRVIEIGANFNV